MSRGVVQQWIAKEDTVGAASDALTIVRIDEGRGTWLGFKGYLWIVPRGNSQAFTLVVQFKRDNATPFDIDADNEQRAVGRDQETVLWSIKGVFSSSSTEPIVVPVNISIKRKMEAEDRITMSHDGEGAATIDFYLAGKLSVLDTGGLKLDETV